MTDLSVNEERSSSNVKVICTSTKVTTCVSLLIESLVKSLCTLIEPDAKRSNKIYNMICDKLFDMKLIDESYSIKEFEGMRSQYEMAFYHLIMTAKGSDQTVPMPVWPVHNDWSHYHREFDEMEFLAGGGFGQVYRVVHKLDGAEYAVKKIFIRSEGVKSVMEYLSEVKTFASLNHPNVVQYKAAWLELGTVNGTNCIDADSASDNSSWLSENSDSMVLQRYGTMPMQWATLYIQMTLCKQTLKQWLEKRSTAMVGDTPTIMDIYRQLLRGLSYVHSKGIVHHDVKPSNIFIQTEANENEPILIQLGDFGLACPLQNNKHSLAVGTRMYAAPEQLLGKCDPKSDLYSLGICLLELSESYSTDMERVLNISALRTEGKLSTSISEPMASIIRQLTALKPESRPNASDLLTQITLDDSQRMTQLRFQLEQKEMEIERLKKILKVHGIRDEL